MLIAALAVAFTPISPIIVLAYYERVKWYSLTLVIVLWLEQRTHARIEVVILEVARQLVQLLVDLISAHLQVSDGGWLHFGALVVYEARHAKLALRIKRLRVFSSVIVLHCCIGSH